MLKKTFGELINITTAAILVICMLMAGYLIFANVYHSKELTNVYLIREGEITKQQKYVAEVDKLTTKLAALSFEKFGQTDKKIYYQMIQIDLNKCMEQFKASTYYMNLQSIDALTNYRLSNSFSNNIYGECLRGQFMSINNVITESIHKDEEMKTLMLAFDQTILNINNSNELIRNILIGNSTYSFTTFDTRMTLYNENKILYNAIAENYNLSLNIVSSLINHIAIVAEGEV